MKGKINAALAALALASAAQAADGISVEFPGSNNSLVRIEGDARYLLMPVQESNDDATVRVLVDGRLEKTIYVRLAKTKVDYSVPFDLTPYRGHKVTLNILSSQGRGSVREAKEDVAWSNFALADTFDTTNTERYRPAFHHTPSYGWMNDPNGMFYDGERWHLYYQTNPYGSKWQNMTWGHSSSADLVDWEHHPLAIEPDGLGAIFSGSCVVDSAGTAGFGPGAVIALYTSADASQMQSMAYSTDGGKNFTKWPGNPVLVLESEARDPNMFWHAPTNEWIMVLAHALEHEMLVFASPNLRDWTLRSSFGKGLGSQDGVWECPDLFRLPVEGEDTQKWVFICNINPGGPFGGSGTQYFTGEFDGTTFTPDSLPDGTIPTKWMDHGKDNYAGVSWSDAPDNRRTLIGWMSNWQYAAEVPTTQFRSANTLPREMGLFRGADGQVYLSCTPSPEVDVLRDRATVKASGVSAGSNGRSYRLPSANDGICEIDIDLKSEHADSVMISLSNEAGEKVDLCYKAADRTLAMDRRASGKDDFSQEFPGVTVAPLYGPDGSLSLRIFVDRSSIEVFADGGRSSMTNLVFPTQPYTTLTVKGIGGKARIENLKIYPLRALF